MKRRPSALSGEGHAVLLDHLACVSSQQLLWVQLHDAVACSYASIDSRGDVDHNGHNHLFMCFCFWLVRVILGKVAALFLHYNIQIHTMVL